jgi:DNA polymerase-1
MKHILFSSDTTHLSTAILIKESALNRTGLLAYYVNALVAKNINSNKLVAFSLRYDAKNKCSAATIKDYLSILIVEINKLGIKNILCADGNYFKYLTSKTKTESFHGCVLPCAIKGFEHINVILSVNYQAMEYNPNILSKLKLSLDTLASHMGGNLVKLGSNIITTQLYYKTLEEIKDGLANLHQYDELTCDIEGLSLEFWNCGVSTITFCWNKHEGAALMIDRGDCPIESRLLLKEFLESYKGKLTYHNSQFDCKVLVYTLWMKDLGDYVGMLDGIDLLTKNFDDTKLIAYLATNNAVQNILGLKALAQEYAGDYAEDTSDTSKIPIDRLLKYNLTDGLCTWYVKEKYWDVMVQDQQLALYEDLFKPSVKTLLQTELCGMPIDPVKVQEAKVVLSTLVDGHTDFLQEHPLIKDFWYVQLMNLCDEMTAKAKKKVYTIDDPVIAREQFNPGSGLQLQHLIYDYMGYPVTDWTDTKQPATGKKILHKLAVNTTNGMHKEILERLVELSAANKILTSFIPAFENAQQLPDGEWRLYGNFNLGGTVSGRLSSSNPNLTNIPSHSVYSKLIKECFLTKKGLLFGGADFNSLEAMISALTTKDKNKLKVYTDGYDSHCINAFSYYREEMPNIVDTLDSINSIKKLYPDYRQASKPITFLLTYGGTYHGLMANIGLSEKQAQQIESNYHMLYEESDVWVANKIKQACIDGYVTGAFGLRLRTPLIAKCKPDHRLKHTAAAEARTAGNMLGQSYGMLNTRAANKFMERVWASKYRYNIFPSCQIHDSIYLIFTNSIAIVGWINTNLIQCMSWQDLPELEHDQVKLGAELDIYHPNWTKACTLPNNVSITKIKEIANAHRKIL